VDDEGTTVRPTAVEELDRVLGGGLVSGSVTLLGGEPGVGKSTLLLQAAAGSVEAGGRALYVAAEESAAQVRRRAERLGTVHESLWVVSEGDVDDVVAHLEDFSPDLVIVDSVQTVGDRSLSGAPGTVAQVREVGARLAAWARSRNGAVVLVGHVTKEGQLAGPRVLEHLVDTVLMLEGDRHHSLRLLRAVKHRFGSTAELGVLELGADGLTAVADPSRMLLADRRPDVAGSAVVAAIHGGRPLLAEVQVLVVPGQVASPRCAAQGLDTGRVSLLMAVLRQRGRLAFEASEVHCSVVGGLRLGDPGVDAGIVLAMASAVTGVPVPADVVVFGEVGLGGELRAAGRSLQRLGEAGRLGFRRALVPSAAEWSDHPGAEPMPDVEALISEAGVLRQDDPFDDLGGIPGDERWDEERAFPSDHACELLELEAQRRSPSLRALEPPSNDQGFGRRRR
jgi:DNA repair protein RadA/Sms